MSRLLLPILLAAIAGAPPPPREPRPLTKLPDDADPSCASGCYLFNDSDACATGCRMAASARQRRAEAVAVAEAGAIDPAPSEASRERFAAYLRERAEREEATAHAKAEKEAADRLAATPEKTLRRRERLALRARGAK